MYPLPAYASLLLLLLLTLLTTTPASPLAPPAPPATPAIPLPQGLRSDLHCGMIACPSGDADGHAFCQTVGCDHCVVVASSPPTTHYECDGLRRGTGGDDGASLTV